MVWENLLFMHWPVPAEGLRPLIPKPLMLDTFDGQAWLAVVPFYMRGVRPRWMPDLRLPTINRLPELNVRTYVTGPGGKPGVYFFSLDAGSALIVATARRFFLLPYYRATMRCEAGMKDIAFHSRRTHRHAAPADFAARYRPVGEVFHAAPDSLEYFLTERYCFYTVDGRGRAYRCDIHHDSWPLQRAEVMHNTMTLPLNLDVASQAFGKPLLHFARGIDVTAWKLTVCAS